MEIIQTICCLILAVGGFLLGKYINIRALNITIRNNEMVINALRNNVRGLILFPDQEWVKEMVENYKRSEAICGGNITPEDKANLAIKKYKKDHPNSKHP